MDHKPRFSFIRILIVMSMVIALFLMSTLLRNKVVQPVQAQQEVIDFEDMPEGTEVSIGQGFQSGGLLFCVEPYTDPRDGEVYDFGSARIDGMIVENSRVLSLEYVTVRLGFSGEITHLEFDYLDRSFGDIYIEINGKPSYGSSDKYLDDQVIGGVSVGGSLVGADVYHLTLDGVIESFAIGGTGIAIDNVQLEGNFSTSGLCNQVVDFEDMPEGTEYLVGQGFRSSGGLPFCIESYTDPEDGEEYDDGSAYIYMEDSRVLELQYANVRLGFSGEINRLEFDYLDKHDENINIEINGERIDGSSIQDLTIDRELIGVSVNAQEAGADVIHLTLEGVIESFAIGSRGIAIDNIQLEGDFSPLSLCNSAFRTLLVTNKNRVAEYNISIQPGDARGHANQFNQWLVIVLDQDRRPLDVYGIWDPRLTLVHGVEDIHSTLEFDANTAYLFDLVFRVVPGDSGELATEVLLYDQNLTLLADVVLIPAITDYYCSEEGGLHPECDTFESLVINPISDLGDGDFDSRPAAITPEQFDYLGDSELIANCLLSLPLADFTDFTPEEMAEILLSLASTCQ